MGLDREARKSIQRVKGEIYKRTGAASDLDKKMRMEVDVSDYTIEEVLSIEEKDGLWRLVAFLLKSLNKTKRNYKIYNKEMLVIIRGLKNWRYLLEGTHFKFEI